MSLVAFAVRIAMVRSLRAALPSAFTVLDSPVDPIGLLESSPTSGLVAVYTGVGDNRLDGVGFFAGNPVLTMTVQIFLPQSTAFAYADAAGAPQTLALDLRGAGADTALDVVERMVDRALAVQAGAWSTLFAAFVMRVRSAVSASYLVETVKVKAPARELTLTCETLQEPTPGAPVADVWADLLTAMRADASADSVAPLADWIAAELAAPAGLTPAEIDRVFLGLRAYAAQLIDLGPGVPDTIPATDLGEGVPAQEVVAIPLDPLP